MNRRNLTLALAALMIMTFAATAYAGWGGGPGRGGCAGWGGGNGYKAQQLTPEQQDKLDVLMIDYQKKIEPLRKDALAKRYELEALMVEPEANEAKINTLAKELGETQAKLFQLRIELRTELSELGIENFGRRGMGRGMGPCAGAGNCPGYGKGKARGGCPGGAPCGGPVQGGGYGPGNCPGGPCS